MDGTPEQSELAKILRMEELEQDVLGELAAEIVFDGGHDSHTLKAQDLLNALGDVDDVPWHDVAFAVGELFAGYVVNDFEERRPNKREALKIQMCVSIQGIACSHGQVHAFENSFAKIFELMAKTDEVIWDQRLDILANALRRWREAR